MWRKGSQVLAGVGGGAGQRGCHTSGAVGEARGTILWDKGGATGKRKDVYERGEERGRWKGSNRRGPREATSAKNDYAQGRGRTGRRGASGRGWEVTR